MSECQQLSDRMPSVAGEASAWTHNEAQHLAQCADCAEEWRVVLAGAALYANMDADHARITSGLLERIRGGGKVIPLRRLQWRNFALGLAAAASIALTVWIPNRSPAISPDDVPGRLGLQLPRLSALTDEGLDRVSYAASDSATAGMPGALPHLGDLSEVDLEQLSQLSENP